MDFLWIFYGFLKDFLIHFRVNLEAFLCHFWVIILSNFFKILKGFLRDFSPFRGDAELMQAKSPNQLQG